MSYVPPEEQETKITITGMYSQLAFNLAVGAGTLLIFGFLRPKNGIVYAPKQKYATEKKKPPKIENNGLFSWVKPVISSSEELLIEKIGLDAVMFLRFLRMCRNMFLWLFLLGIIIMGINVYGTKQDRKQFPKTDNPMQYLSISYLRKSLWFWTHVLFTWVFSTIIYWFLYKQYKEYSVLKRQYFQSDEYQSSLHSRTLLITGVPSNMQSDQALQKYLVENLKVSQPILQAHISRKVGRLPELIEEHDKTVRKLESVLTKYLKDPNNISSKRPKHSLGGHCGGEKVDSINYYTTQIQNLEEEIHSEREKIKERKTTNYGFVSFTNIVDAHSVAKKLEGKSHLGVGPELMLAPWPKDIIWGNLTLASAVRGTKKYVGYGFFLLLCFFWIIPVSLLSTAAQIQNIVKIAPFTERFLYANDFVAGFIEAWMSPLIMAAFFLILPGVFRILSKHQGKLTKSSLDRSVLAKLYLFFIINSIFLYTLSSTLLDMYAKIKSTIDAGNTEFKDIYKVVKETDFLDEVADSLIKVSSFWINYISLRGLGAIFDLAQIISLVLTKIKKFFVKPTPRNLKEFSRPPDFDYPVYYNVHLFFFTVGMLYSVIAPLILVFCLGYFALALLIYRYQLMYVFTTKIETGGTFWRVVFNRLIASLIVWQVVMVGVMNLKGAHIQSVALIPLPAITLLVKFICAKRFDAQIRYYKPEKSDPYNYKSFDHTTNDIVSRRFGHPVLTAELITPMVHSNVKHLLGQVYSGRIEEDRISRRGTIRSMSTIMGNNNQKFKIEAVDKEGLEWDEQAYYEEQKPGYYVDYNEFDNTPMTQQQQFRGIPHQKVPHLNNNPGLSPNNNNYHQPRPVYPHDNNTSLNSHLLRQESPTPSSVYSDDTISHHMQPIINYNNSAYVPPQQYNNSRTPPRTPPPPQQYNNPAYNLSQQYNNSAHTPPRTPPPPQQYNNSAYTPSPPRTPPLQQQYNNSAYIPPPHTPRTPPPPQQYNNSAYTPPPRTPPPPQQYNNSAHTSPLTRQQYNQGYNQQGYNDQGHDNYTRF